MLLIALFVPSNCGGCCTADVDKAPFQVTETGWGEFPLQIKLTFVSEAQEKPLTIVHQLKLHHWVPPPPPGPDGVRLHPFLSDLPSHSARVHLFFFPQPGCSPSLELGQTNAIASLHLRSSPLLPLPLPDPSSRTSTTSWSSPTPLNPSSLSFSQVHQHLYLSSQERRIDPNSLSKWSVKRRIEWRKAGDLLSERQIVGERGELVLLGRSETAETAYAPLADPFGLVLSFSGLSKRRGRWLSSRPSWEPLRLLQAEDVAKKG
jgi:hypothetical protein